MCWMGMLHVDVLARTLDVGRLTTHAQSCAQLPNCVRAELDDETTHEFDAMLKRMHMEQWLNYSDLPVSRMNDIRFGSIRSFSTWRMHRLIESMAGLPNIEEPDEGVVSSLASSVFWVTQLLRRHVAASFTIEGSNVTERALRHIVKKMDIEGKRVENPDQPHDRWRELARMTFDVAAALCSILHVNVVGMLSYKRILVTPFVHSLLWNAQGLLYHVTYALMLPLTVADFVPSVFSSSDNNELIALKCFAQSFGDLMDDLGELKCLFAVCRGGQPCPCLCPSILPCSPGAVTSCSPWEISWCRLCDVSIDPHDGRGA